MTIFKSNICLTILLLFISQMLLAQQDPRKFDPGLEHRIGDAFKGPKKVQWMRGDVRSIKWKSWHDKVIVLDFFDTYCTSCILSMPHLQKLQQQFGDKIQILNVTWQDKATLDKFFATNEYLKEHQVNLPVIYNDKILRSMFPYQAAPHIAMIYKGKVQAITFNRLLTADNIEKLLNDGRIDLPWKNDFGKGSLTQDNSIEDIGVWLSGYQSGVMGQSLKFEKDSLTGNYKTSIYNREPYAALINTWGKIVTPRALLRAEQVVWNVSDSSHYKNFTNSGEAWDVKHSISYERIDRIHRADSVQAKVVLQDLHNFLGIKTYWSKKRIKCLILKKCPIEKTEKVFDGIARYEGTDVFSKFMAFRDDYPLIYDEAKLTDILEIGVFNSLDELNEQLRQYGLELREGEAEFETFVVEEEK